MFVNTNMYSVTFLKILLLQIILSYGEITLTNHIYEDTALLIPKTLKSITQQIFENGQIPDKLLNFYMPIFANSTLCKTDSEMYKNSFKSFDSWAIKMWDSSGKIPSGLMHMHFHDLGNYYECLEVPEIGPYHVQYCMAEIKSIGKVWNTGFDWENQRSFMAAWLPLIKPYLYLGRCLPASCDENDLIAHFSKVFERSKLSIYIDKFSCTKTNEYEPYTTLDWISILLTVLTLFLIVFSTVNHQYLTSQKEKGFAMELIECYSLKRNLKEFFTISESNNLLCLNGLKVISSLYLIFLHNAVTYFSLPTINYNKLMKLLTSDIYIFVVNSVMVIDVFFIVGGLLISNSEIRNLKLGKKFDISAYYIRRFFRIFPTLVLQMLFFVTLYYRYYGNGPLWKHDIGPIRDNCIKNWWTNLLFINNYVRQEDICIGSNWYLAVDTQLHTIAPIILFSIIKWKFFRKICLPLILFLSGVLTSYLSYVNKYRAGNILERDLRTNDSLTLYLSTESRIGVWLMGLYLGYILNKIKENKSVHLSKVTLITGWSITILVLIYNFFSTRYFVLQPDDEFVNLIHSLQNGFNRIITSFSICWIIFVCELGYGGFINKILSWNRFQTFGKLVFMTYITNFLLMYGFQSSIITSTEFTIRKSVIEFISYSIICYFIAFFLYFLIEAPFLNIGKLIIKKKNNKKLHQS
ncbi:nose resistant to fluoxetine protein 6-like isoform X2 [Lycorma delicatula]|uniref:nose resistant to fluoxetine protein 6-like isoform X2 n=1 Tax=Lycorma delicatula TaxID=130591 RepID=UPI003F513174